MLFFFFVSSVLHYFEFCIICFHRPIINGKVEEKTCGEGPSLANMFEDDKQLQETINNIRESISAGFDATLQYANTFEVYREFYSENERLDIEAFRREIDGKFVFYYMSSLSQHKA